MRKSPVVFLLAFLVLAFPASAGTLAFLTTPTTVDSGDANSFMNLYADCATLPCAPVNVLATPTLATPVTLTTQMTATHLVFEFTIRDATRHKEGGGPLTLGEKIVVQIDPDKSGGTQPEAGTGINRDYRYEITLKENGISNALNRDPSGGASWGAPNVWCNFPAPVEPATLPQVCTNAQGTATLLAHTPNYQVRLEIPLSVIGTPGANGFGLAIAIVNDLGHDTINPMTMASVQNITAVVFPAGELPASNDPYSDPGLISSVPGTLGAWTMPGQWGTGYVSPPSGALPQLTMSHTPQPWVSNAIKLSTCDAATWNEIGVADDSLDQTALAKWYLYNSDDPCKMGIWVRVNNSGASAGARLLVMWADGGISPGVWRKVALSGPIAFPAGDSTIKVVWDKVPHGGLGLGHPCLRVYIVPETLNAADPMSGVVQTDAVIEAINDGNKLAAFERAYGVPAYPWNAQVAQMNFTNLVGGACDPNGVCKQPAIVMWQQLLYAAIDAAGPRPAYAQSQPRARVNAIPLPRYDGPRPGKGDFAFAQVTIQGFAAPAGGTKNSYLFVEPLGGTAFAVPMKLLEAKAVALKFNVANPPIAFRQFDAKSRKAREIKSPPRTIVLAATAEAPKGMGKLRLARTQPKVAFKPGESRSATALVAIADHKYPPAKKPADKTADKTKEKAR